MNNRFFKFVATCMVILLTACFLSLAVPSKSHATVAPTPTSVGLYNVEFGHRVAPHVKMILDDAERHDLDILGLEEIQDYLPALSKAAPQAGYRVLGNGLDSRNAIMVRSSLRVQNWGWFKSPGFYYSVKGNRVTTAVNVWAKIRGVTYVVVHAPVTAWIPCHCQGGRGFHGPSRRLVAYRLFIQSLSHFSRHHRGPLVFMGDWNATPGARGYWSPNFLRRVIGGHFVRPYRSTGHGEIDFAVARGITSTRAQVQPNLPVARSDHKLVTTKVVSHG